MHENEIGNLILSESISLHRELGPGLLERVYEMLLYDSFKAMGLEIEKQQPVTFTYRGKSIENAFRVDLLIENKVTVELKSVGDLQDVHKKQLLTYLRLSGLKLGYLLNFGEVLLKDGICRIVNGQLPETPSPCPP